MYAFSKEHIEKGGCTEERNNSANICGHLMLKPLGKTAQLTLGGMCLLINLKIYKLFDSHEILLIVRNNDSSYFSG